MGRARRRPLTFVQRQFPMTQFVRAMSDWASTPPPTPTMTLVEFAAARESAQQLAGFAERRISSAERTSISPISICIASNQTMESTRLSVERPEKRAEEEAAAAGHHNAAGAEGKTGPIHPNTQETCFCTGNCSFAGRGYRTAGQGGPNGSE